MATILRPVTGQRAVFVIVCYTWQTSNWNALDVKLDILETSIPIHLHRGASKGEQKPSSLRYSSAPCAAYDSPRYENV